MTTGKPMKHILMFFFPLLAGNVFQQLYSLVDSVVVGRGLGGDALAAVGATGSLSFLIIGFAQGLTAGFGVNIAIEYGAKNTEGLKRVAANSFILTAGIAATFTVISLVVMRPLLIVMKTDPQVLDDAVAYIRIIFAGITVMMAYNIFSSFLRALGDSRTPFVAIIIASLINIVLDLLFVLAFDMGVAGAAIATVFAQLCSCLFCMRAVAKHGIIHLNRAFFKFDGKLAWSLIKIGIPVAFMSSITAIGCIIVQSFVNAFGKLYMSAFAAISKIINLSMQPGNTIGASVSTFVSQNLGAGKIDRVRQGVRSGSLISLVLHSIVFSLMFFIPRQLISIMVTEQEIIDLTPTYLRMCGCFIFVVGELFVIRSSCMGLKRTIVPMFSGMLELALRIAALLLFSASLGFTAVPIAECAAWTGAMLLNLLDYTVGVRKLSKQQTVELQTTG